MPKQRNDYASSRQGRFIAWLKNKLEPFDEFMEGRIFNEKYKKISEKDDEITALENSLKKRQHDEKLARLEKITADFTSAAYKKGRRMLGFFYALLSILLSLLIVIMLAQTVIEMPARGAEKAAAHNEVSTRYIEKGLEETGAVNIVAGMILDYRAFDTLGESTVLFCAACCVILLLRDDEKDLKEKIENDDRHFEPKNDKILQASARLVTPIIFMLGFYVMLNGHISPGGGFSGGAIIGAGLILYLNAFGFAKTERLFSFKQFKLISLVALGFYYLAKTYSFFMGANHLKSGIPLGNAGDILSSGLILPLNIMVGLVVASTMYVFYALFRKGGV